MEARQRIVVTGHAGYIRAVIVPLLVREGYDVTGLDTFFFHGCDLGEMNLNIQEIHRDIRDVTEEDLAGAYAVIHLAALSNDPMGDLRPELTWEINYRASVRLAQMAKASGVERFLYSSSCSIYEGPAIRC